MVMMRLLIRITRIMLLIMLLMMMVLMLHNCFNAPFLLWTLRLID